MNRNPEKNGGQDTLYTRQRKVFAPFGISYEKKSQATSTQKVKANSSSALTS